MYLTTMIINKYTIYISAKINSKNILITTKLGHFLNKIKTCKYIYIYIYSVKFLICDVYLS